MLSLEFDFKRMPINPRMVGVLGMEHIAFDTAPWPRPEIGERARAYFDGWRRQNCMKTLADWDAWQAHYQFSAARGKRTSAGRSEGGAASLRSLARKPRQDAWRHWARALAYANQANPTAAKEEQRLFDESLADFRARTHRPDPPELQVARLEMLGHIELADAQVDRALKQLDAASKAERRLTYTEPPYYPLPVAEAMGHAALKNNKPAVAERAFRTALEQYPSDAHAEQGLKAALNGASTKLAAAR